VPQSHSDVSDIKKAFETLKPGAELRNLEALGGGSSRDFLQTFLANAKYEIQLTE
jgi:hypothetical protein